MFYLLLIAIGIVGVGIYLAFFLQNVPGALEERVGKLEALPPDVGVWRTDTDSPEARAAAENGLEREVRTFFDESRQKLLSQSRYRERETRRIARVDPDRVIKRHRVRS